MGNVSSVIVWVPGAIPVILREVPSFVTENKLALPPQPRISVPSGKMLGVSSVELPTATVTVEGATSCNTVTVLVAVLPPTVAVMVAVPEPTAVTKPELLTVATEVLLDVHATVPVAPVTVRVSLS